MERDDQESASAPEMRSDPDLQAALARVFSKELERPVEKKKVSEHKAPGLLRATAPYALGYLADYAVSRKAFDGNWEGHERNPIGRSAAGRVALGVFGPLSQGIFDQQLQKAGHKNWARAFRAASLLARAYVIKKNASDMPGWNRK